MKICWDNLENLEYNKKTGKWRKDGHYYIYKESCEGCKEEYLGRSESKFCSSSCIRKNIKHTEKTRNKMSESHKGIIFSEEHKQKISESNKGKKLSADQIRHLKKSRKGSGNPMYGKLKSNSGHWKGGVTKKGIPLYDTYASQIEWCEEVRRNEEDPNVLEIKCFKCSKWYIPKINNIYTRVQYLKGNKNYTSESLFYCSDECKNSCSIYHKSVESIMKEDAIKSGRMSWINLDREVQPELRQLVLKRDKYTCMKCGNNKNLHCHHIYPVSINPLESADIDNCITYCVDCHKEAHQKDGCRYGQLNICIEYK